MNNDDAHSLAAILIRLVSASYTTCDPPFDNEPGNLLVDGQLGDLTGEEVAALRRYAPQLPERFS